MEWKSMYMCACVYILFVTAMPQRPTAGYIIVLFNAVGFAWQWQQDVNKALGTAGAAGISVSE